ncbi:hypothetical protein ACQP3F_32950, partial [Escherichia coli]
KRKYTNSSRQHIPIILAPERCRQEDQELKIIFSCTTVWGGEGTGVYVCKQTQFQKYNKPIKTSNILHLLKNT